MCTCMCVVCMYVIVCVCEREREKEKERMSFKLCFSYPNSTSHSLQSCSRGQP